MPDSAEPVVIIKKLKAHGGHHGGAWKVAYADFVTAMMAFFLVMWLMNSSKEVREAVAGYFNDPSGQGEKKGSGAGGVGDTLAVSRDGMSRLKDSIDQAMRQMPEFRQLRDQVAMTVTGEGLRIELMETEHGMFFNSGSSNPSGNGEEMLVLLAQELARIPNEILIEGHTDSRPFPSNGSYSNWELSADRANSARRLMETKGLRSGQVTQVRGYADRRLRNKDDPQAPSNRRISVIVKYQAETPSGAAAPANPATH